MSSYGYSYGQPFGDPEGFTRSTQESEIDRFNQWMRSQPWWQSASHSPSAVEQQLAAMGIRLPDSFHIDEAGNVNQKSRAGTIAKWTAIGGGAALGGLGLAGMGPLAGLFGGGGAAASAAAPALEGGGTLAANLGAASALPAIGAGAAGAAAIPALEGGATLAANLGAESALPALSAAGGGSGIAHTVGKFLGKGENGFGASDLIKLLGAGGLATYGAMQNRGPAYPPELDEILKAQKQRMDSQTPLYNSILQLSKSRLPTSVQG